MNDSSSFRRTDARLLLLAACACWVLLAAVVAYGAPGPGTQTAPPKNRSQPTIVGDLREGETVTASPGAWRGTQPIEFAFKWVSCTRRVSNCGSIPGATQRKYEVRSRDVGRRLIVSVTASNRDGGSSAESDASAVIRRCAS